MSAEAPDTVARSVDRARELLTAAGCDVVNVIRVGPSEERSAGKRTMVIRQRSCEGGGIELTVAPEWRTPIRQND
jgi:hypothetical protein